jgi:hypothetical protein
MLHPAHKEHGLIQPMLAANSVWYKDYSDTSMAKHPLTDGWPAWFSKNDSPNQL